jgi:hypothetical protein
VPPAARQRLKKVPAGHADRDVEADLAPIRPGREDAVQTQFAFAGLEAGRDVSPAGVVALQREAGNRAVSRLIAKEPQRLAPAQRDDDAQQRAAPTPQADAESPGPGDVPPAAQALVGSEFSVDLDAPDPLAVPDTSGMGDFPAPDGSDGTGPADGPPTAMAYSDRLPPLQRDDDKPHVSGDVSAQGGAGVAGAGAGQAAPVQVGLTLIYRNLDVWQSPDGNWELVHEPQIQLIGDSRLTLSVQEAITMVNATWMPPWQAKIEFGLSAFAQQQLLPALGSSYGTQLQAEQHVNAWFSVTGTLTGTYTPPFGGQTEGMLSLGAGIGVLVHLDGIGGGK